MNGPHAKAWYQKSSPGPRARRVKIRSTDKNIYFHVGVGLTTMSSLMASTTASRAAAADARHGLRHEAADTARTELKKEGATAAAARLKAQSALPFVCSCVLYATVCTAGATARQKNIT